MTGLTDEQRAAAEGYTAYVFTIAKNMAISRNCLHLLDEMASVAYVSLCEAVTRFDPNRGASMKTYIIRLVRDSLANFLRKNQRWEKDRRGRLTIHTRFNGFDRVDAEDLLRVLTPRDREVFRKVYLDECPRQDICRLYGFSNQRLSQILKRARNRLKRELDETAS